MPGWLRVSVGCGVVAFATLQVFVALGFSVAGRGVEALLTPMALHGAQTAIFCCVGMIAVWRGQDKASRYLGIAFLLIAAGFAVSVLRLNGPSNPVVSWLGAVALDGLLPWATWQLARHLPRVTNRTRADDIAKGAANLSLSVGLLLLFSDALQHAVPELMPLARTGGSAPYWLIIFSLVIPALAMIVWRALGAQPTERDRVVFFATALAIPATLLALVVLAGGHPAVSNFFRSEESRFYLVPFIQMLLIAMPIGATYAVLVKQSIPFALPVRARDRYVAAIAIVEVTATIPSLILFVQALRLSEIPLQEMLDGARGVYFSILLIVGIAAIILRPNARRMIDEAFFRAPIDASSHLANLRRDLSRAEQKPDVIAAVKRCLDRSIAPSLHHVLEYNQESGVLSSDEPAVRALHQTEELLTALASVTDASELVEQQSVLSHQAQWLVDLQIKELVPVVDTGKNLRFLLCLGEKRSELPYVKGDREFLQAIGDLLSQKLASTAFEKSLSIEVAEVLATRCSECASVYDGALTCEECQAPTVPTNIPLQVNGKYRLRRVLGVGGAGVVYLADDLNLPRQVALKTLPLVTSARVLGLRREAESMARVRHANLAQIFGLESYRGLPIVVTEYFPNGTLEDRMNEGPSLSTDDVVRIGVSIANALQRIHSVGLLHLDVKPSNIAFAADGEAVLIDFGVAGFLSSSAIRSDSEMRMGTPEFMSPELLRGETPDEWADLWALGRTLEITMESVRSNRSADDIPGATSKQGILEWMQAGRRGDYLSWIAGVTHVSD